MTLVGHVAQGQDHRMFLAITAASTPTTPATACCFTPVNSCNPRAAPRGGHLPSPSLTLLSFLVLGMTPRASSMLGQLFPTEPHPYVPHSVENLGEAARMWRQLSSFLREFEPSVCQSCWHRALLLDRPRSQFGLYHWWTSYVT